MSNVVESSSLFVSASFVKNDGDVEKSSFVLESG
jgi:hypothetical protein